MILRPIDFVSINISWFSKVLHEDTTFTNSTRLFQELGLEDCVHLDMILLFRLHYPKSGRYPVSCSPTQIKVELFMRRGPLRQWGPNGTLCLTICCVIFAVWVPIGSAEPRRLSVALSHSPRGSRASWNWRAKTCSSSSCLCLQDKTEGKEKMIRRFHWCFIAFFFAQHGPDVVPHGCRLFLTNTVY